VATIRIRDIPEDVYETIRRRARAAGQSIQAYALAQVTEPARRRTKYDALAATAAAMAAEESPGTSVVSILRALAKPGGDGGGRRQVCVLR
jgi:hypothetical protein